MVNKILSGLDFCSETTMFTLSLWWENWMGYPWLNSFCRSMLPAGKMIENAKKASANKIKTLKILIQTAQHLTYLGWTYAPDFFSALYHPQDARDEKVSSALVHWEHGEMKTLVPLWFRRFHGNSMESMGITTEFRRNPDGMSPWQNSDEKSVGNPSRFRQFRRDSVVIPSRFPCSQCARAKLTFSSRASWGW